MRCQLCQIAVGGFDELEDINKKTPFSRKSIRAIITYLAKTAKPAIDVPWSGDTYANICKICVNDILIYDEYMVKLLEVQKRIISSLRNPPINEEYLVIQSLDESMSNVDLKIEKVEISVEANIESSDCGNDDGNNSSLEDNEIKETDVNYNEDFENVEDLEDLSELDEIVEESTPNNRRCNVPVNCHVCNKIFKNKTQRRRHVNVVHKPTKQIWKCEICGITTKDEEYLELHKNIHEGKSDLECRYCNKRYTRKINVIRHMHKHWDKKKFQCERCGLRFSERPIYYNHRLQHEAEEDPLICEVCNQSFKTRRTYRNHLWVHREDRPRYSCEICGKTFVEKYTLKVHLRCHNEKEEERSTGRRKIINEPRQEEKTFECVICGEQFSSKDLCDQHMKVQHDVILRAENIFM
ncbi:serendipity locus protein delta-like [Anastrepha obliqua]|uniref:serendipity locus protein delta-like n=1 Tax=Anastrepha obliqua TaxID=95512 RepID=UPI0024093881|nr:serendipity locus protein delta-like [Anastrepha obliqua]